MANEIVAAAIQGVCTLAAAGLAVVGGSLALRNYRKEIPGRRRIELAEQVLVALIEANSSISNLDAECRQTVSTAKTRWMDLSETNELVRARDQARKAVQLLEQAGKVADLYFDGQLHGPIRKIWKSYIETSGISLDIAEAIYFESGGQSFSGAGGSSTAPDFRSFLHEQRERFDAAYEVDGYYTLLEEGVDQLTSILGPHLGS